MADILKNTEHDWTQPAIAFTRLRHKPEYKDVSDEVWNDSHRTSKRIVENVKKTKGISVHRKHILNAIFKLEKKEYEMLVNIFGEYRRPATLTDDEPRMCIKFLRHAREYRDFETKIKLLESMLGGTESTTGAPKISLLGLKQVKEYAEELEKTNEETEKKLQSAMNNLGGLKARYLKLRTLAETKLQEAKAQINVITTQSEEFKEKFKQRDEDYKITAEENRALETKQQELDGLEDSFNNMVEEHRGL